jgi:CHAT domain-containing protein
MVHARQNRFVEAVTLATEASEMRDRLAATILATGTDEQKRLYMNTLMSQTSLDISLHVQHAPTRSDAARLAFTDILRRKGRVLDAVMNGVAAVRRSNDPADQALLEQLTSVYSQFANHVARGRGKMPPEQYRKELATLETTRKSLENEISKRHSAFQNLVTLSDVQARIPRDAALVEIARYSPIPFRKSSLANSPIAPHYVAYILYEQGDPVFVDLGEAIPIEAAIDAFRVALSDHDLTHDPKQVARRLDELVMRPIRKLLGHRRWVFLSLDGPLHLVPFGALLDERGYYLVEDYLISYLTTGRELLRIGEKRRDPREKPLILANPAFFDSRARRSPQAQHRGLRSVDMVKHPLPPLENTEDEAKTIARLFPQSRMLLGAEATEEAVKAAHGPSVLHLATHGFFLREQPIPEALLRNVGPEPTPAERAALLRRENPLLRSGIALAGFNRRQSGDEDGVLTALEAAALDLDGTRLVVLSTCESGLGQTTAGEGVYGLRRALSIAGAETQVMSLWQVDSGRTQELMQAYYRRLQQGEGRSEAMRAVQLAMLANPETTHPNLWASFIVSGDFRPLDGQVRLPEFGKVLPGKRGCACSLWEQERPSDGLGVALVLGGFVAARGRRRFGRKNLRASARLWFGRG